MFTPSSLLAIDVDESDVRAAIVNRSGGAYSVSEMVKIPRTGVGVEKYLNHEDFDNILSRLKGGRPKKAVIVAHDVRLIDISMEARKVRKMKPAQLAEALRWEAEPYTNIAAKDMLLGYETGRKNDRNEIEIRVSVTAAEEFSALSELLQSEGLKLLRLYPQDVCFPMAAQYGDAAAVKIAVDAGRYLTKVVAVEAGKLGVTQTVPYGSEKIRAAANSDMDKAFREALEAAKGAANHIVLSGEGATDAEVVSYLKRVSGLDVVVWRPNVQGGLSPSAATQTDFAAAIGGALREMGYSRASSAIGITSLAEFAQRLQSRVYLLPAAAVALWFLFLAGQFAYCSFMTGVVQAENEQLQKQRDEEKKDDDFVEAKRREAGSIKQRVTRLQRQLTFQETGCLGDLELLERFLRGLAKHVPSAVQLDNVTQTGDGVYLIVGRSANVDAVHILSTGLAGEAWCAAASVGEIAKQDAIVEENLGDTYAFKLTVTVRGGAAQ